MSNDAASSTQNHRCLSDYGHGDHDRLARDAAVDPSLAVELAAWLISGTLGISTSMTRDILTERPSDHPTIVLTDLAAGYTISVGVDDGEPVWKLETGQHVTLRGMTLPPSISGIHLSGAAKAWCTIEPRISPVVLHSSRVRDSVIEATASELGLPKATIIRLFTRTSDIE